MTATPSGAEASGPPKAPTDEDRKWLILTRIVLILAAISGLVAVVEFAFDRTFFVGWFDGDDSYDFAYVGEPPVQAFGLDPAWIGPFGLLAFVLGALGLAGVILLLSARILRHHQPMRRLVTLTVTLLGLAALGTVITLALLALPFPESYTVADGNLDAATGYFTGGLEILIESGATSSGLPIVSYAAVLYLPVVWLFFTGILSLIATLVVKALREGNESTSPSVSEDTPTH